MCVCECTEVNVQCVDWFSLLLHINKDQTEPKKKKKKKKNIQRVENSDQKPVENLPEKKPEPMALEKESEYPEDPPESPPESPTVNREDSELEGDVYQPIMDLNKDSRRHRSDIGTPRESEDSKMNLSSLLCDEWQPRRSERIFINSSVTTNSSTSPLSPTGKGHEFPWSKKSKKGPGMKSVSKVLSVFEFQVGTKIQYEPFHSLTVASPKLVNFPNLINF